MILEIRAFRIPGISKNPYESQGIPKWLESQRYPNIQSNPLSRSAVVLFFKTRIPEESWKILKILKNPNPCWKWPKRIPRLLIDLFCSKNEVLEAPWIHPGKLTENPERSWTILTDPERSQSLENAQHYWLRSLGRPKMIINPRTMNTNSDRSWIILILSGNGYFKKKKEEKNSSKARNVLFIW